MVIQKWLLSIGYIKDFLIDVIYHIFFVKRNDTISIGSKDDYLWIFVDDVTSKIFVCCIDISLTITLM